MNILSAALLFVAVILDAIMFFVVKDLDLYGERTTARPLLVEMRPMHRPAIETAIDGEIHIILFTFLYFDLYFYIFVYFRHFTGS